MLEMLGEHHDEGLCALQAVHPVVRKAVRRLGTVYDYDVSRFVSRNASHRPNGDIPDRQVRYQARCQAHQYAYGTVFCG